MPTKLWAHGSCPQAPEPQDPPKKKARVGQKGRHCTCTRVSQVQAEGHDQPRGPVLASLEWRPARAHPLPMPSLPTHSPGYTVGMSPDSAPTTEMEGKATLVHGVLRGESGEG